MKPSLSIEKPRIGNEDLDNLERIYQIKINNSQHQNVSNEIIDEYNKNMDEQTSIVSLKNLPTVLEFLKLSLQQSLDKLPYWLWRDDESNCDNEEERECIYLVRLILTDYHANCYKPAYPIPGSINERTPFIEFVIPIFKYFSSVTKLLSFQWYIKH